MLRALEEYEIEGLKTLIPFHQALLATEQWAKGETCRDLLEDKAWLKTLAFEKPAPKGEDEDEPEKVEQSYTVEVSGQRFDVKVVGPPLGGGVALNGSAPAGQAAPKRAARAKSASAGRARHRSSRRLQGNMWKVLVKQGDIVTEGQILCIIEAMKMENEITAHKAGTIAELPIIEGEPINAGAPIATIKSEAPADES